jgi:putative membrane protein insertion efficiency factor
MSLIGCSRMFLKKPIFLSPDKRPGLDRWLCAPILLLLYLYKGLISPLLGNACRFHPSCSLYAREAFLHRSFPKACYLTLRRLCKCHPFHPGGYDPLDPDDKPSGADTKPHPNAGEPKPDHHGGDNQDG